MLKWQGVEEGLWPLKIPSWKILYEDHSRSVRFWGFLGGFLTKFDAKIIFQITNTQYVKSRLLSTFKLSNHHQV